MDFFFSLFFLCLELAAKRHLFGFKHFPVGLFWDIYYRSWIYFMSKKILLNREIGFWLKNILSILRILSFEWTHRFVFLVLGKHYLLLTSANDTQIKNVKCEHASLSLCNLDHHTLSRIMNHNLKFSAEVSRFLLWRIVPVGRSLHVQLVHRTQPCLHASAVYQILVAINANNAWFPTSSTPGC